MIKARIESLRNEMRKREIDAYIINSADPHLSEYVAEHWKSRKWISNFTGSAGTVVVTLKEAGLWTDGRYYIQAEKQLEGSGIDLFKMNMPKIPTFYKWIKDVLPNNSYIGFDGRAFSVASVRKMQQEWTNKNFSLRFNEDMINHIWINRPKLPTTNVIEHDLKYCGKSRTEKFSFIRSQMQKKDIEAIIVSALDEVAWLFNLRGNDVKCNPVTTAFGILENEKAHLFINQNKLSTEIAKSLKLDEIEIHDYDEIYSFVKDYNQKIMFSADSTNFLLFSSLNENIHKLEDNYLIPTLKAKKNTTEIKNLKKTLEIDMVALTKFICWIKDRIGKEKITEISAQRKLFKFRQISPEFKDNSFAPISAFGANAAMMHYSANETNSAEFIKNGFYLIDSGGQYLSGTTDITRTIALGKLTYEQKRDFTLVLQGVIDLSNTKFLEGTTGSNLDILARRPVWQYGIDYKCGTGHGVGYYLNVHEGPQYFSQKLINVPLESGMITTVEPGVYKENQYGIRIENMLLTKTSGETEFGKWLNFETISFCPIDLDAILPELLNSEQREWLNNYHQKAYKIIAPYLSEKEKKQLHEMTKPIV
jgi:Xaa-Pro aminopeptidase